MENKGMSIGEYYNLNNEYLKRKAEVEEAILKHMNENPQEYPNGAKEVYHRSLNGEVFPEEEAILKVTEDVITVRFEDALRELGELRDKIIETIGHIENATVQEDNGNESEK